MINANNLQTEQEHQGISDCTLIGNRGSYAVLFKRLFCGEKFRLPSKASASVKAKCYLHDGRRQKCI